METEGGPSVCDGLWVTGMQTSEESKMGSSSSLQTAPPLWGSPSSPQMELGIDSCPKSQAPLLMQWSYAVVVVSLTPPSPSPLHTQLTEGGVCVFPCLGFTFCASVLVLGIVSAQLILVGWRSHRESILSDSQPMALVLPHLTPWCPQGSFEGGGMG